MPRGARIDAAGSLHHIIVRGIERGKIFQDDDDRDDILRRLGRILTETKTSCYAWALIPNHAHFLFRTGEVPLSKVMGRLLTGYALVYNRRHHRHGQLFQNRYKSILCQEEPYLLELVRYIHLNPLRAGIVKDLSELDGYCYTGHSGIMNRSVQGWQEVDFVLEHFGGKRGVARRRYREFVEEGIERGKRPDLTGGGLIRSMGGWEKVKDSISAGKRVKGDERILGESGFVMEVIRREEEKIERSYELRERGYDLSKIVHEAASLFGIEAEMIYGRGKYPIVVQARSVVCYWGVRELGMSATELAKELGVTQPAVSICVKRGESIIKEKGFRLFQE